MTANVGRSAVRSSLASMMRPRSQVHLRARRMHHGSSTAFASPLRPRLAHVITLGVPLIGGSLLYFYPTEQSPVPTILASPAVIPCGDGDLCPRSFQTHQMSSPNEERMTVLQRVVKLLRDRIWEPLCTGARFLHLFALFAPVIITSPMLFIGKPRGKRGERWGALWWYGFLVAQMQRAGPTFIKVCIILIILLFSAQVAHCHLPTCTTISHSWHNGRDHDKIFSPPSYVNV